MKVLVVMRHSGYLRNFESTLRMLCDRGHRVELAFQGGTHWLLDSGDVAEQLCETYPRFSRSSLPDRSDAWGAAAHELRACLDYLRYLEPEYRNAPRLRDRATRDVPSEFIERTRTGVFATAPGRALLRRWLRALHRAIPRDPRIDAFLEARRPDVLVLTQLVQPESPQAEYVRSARALGIRTAFCVASWDNLTNKGLIHGDVDVVTVWNEMMKREAVDLHGVPAERVVVTGAQPFDHWFSWRPSRDRETFCRRIGLPADRPYILYLCSSRFIAPNEAPFVISWIEQLRGSAYPSLQGAGVLVRPHPQNADQWEGPALNGLGPAVVWPAAGAAPSDDEKRADYFDSIFHSAAVVGVNTTAEIESAIVGRRVYSVLVPEFRETQEGTLHFSHLRDVNGGLLNLARTAAEHLEQLNTALSEGGADDGKCRRFVEAFVRPFGVDVPGTPRLVDALEQLAKRPPRGAQGASVWAPLLRPPVARRGERRLRQVCLAKESKALRAAARARRRKSAPAGTETEGVAR